MSIVASIVKSVAETIARSIEGVGGVITRFVVNLLTATVTRTGTRTVSAFATGAVIADGETLVVVPEDVQALEGYRLATTVADGALEGSELVTDPNFDVGITGWVEARNSSTLAFTNGNLRVTADGTATNGASLPVTTVLGLTYTFVINIDRGTHTNDILTRFDPSSSTLGSSVGQVTFNDPDDGIATIIFTATTTTTHIGVLLIGSSAGTVVEILSS